MGNDQREIENYRAQLHARYERVLHSDRAAVDIGLVALRTAVLVNAGAVVALLAFVGQLWDQHERTLSMVLGGIRPFVYGLICAGVASVVAYFYQSMVTEAEQRTLTKLLAGALDTSPPRWLRRLLGWTAVPMILLVVASYAEFVRGALDIAATLGR